MKLYKKLIRLHAEKEYYEITLSNTLEDEDLIWLSPKVYNNVAKLKQKLQKIEGEIKKLSPPDCSIYAIERRKREVFITIDCGEKSFIFHCWMKGCYSVNALSLFASVNKKSKKSQEILEHLNKND